MDLLPTFKGANLANSNDNLIPVLYIDSFLDTFLTAVKELLMEGQLKDSKEVDAPKLTDAKFIYYYSGIIGSDPSFKDGLKSKYLKSIL